MNKVCSIFSQVLKLFSRGDFEKAVKEHKAERHARGFSCAAVADAYRQVCPAGGRRSHICGGPGRTCCGYANKTTR